MALVLLAVQAGAAALLTGLALTVQLVVYPGFLTAGPLLDAAGWQAVHAAHSRRIAAAVGLPWAVQGVTDAVLPLLGHPGVPRGWLLVGSALGAATVAVTVAWAVPLHTRLGQGWSEAAARRLLLANAVRLVLWAGSAGLALGLLAGR